jgi:hypothetical protein
MHGVFFLLLCPLEICEVQLFLTEKLRQASLFGLLPIGKMLGRVGRMVVDVYEKTVISCP